MARFHLIRHAHNDFVESGKIAGWLPGVHLNAVGKAQAERLAEGLAEAGISAIFSSPLERAMETALAVGRRAGVEVEPCDAFGEVRAGEWTGMEIAALERDPRFRALNRFRSGGRIPGGEAILEVQARMVLEMERRRAERPGVVMAIVSHADPIRTVLAYYAGIPLDLFHRVEIATASVTTIEVEDWGPRILAVNRTFT